MHHIAPHRAPSRPIAPHCTTLHHIAPHCTPSHHIAPHRATLHHIAPHCTTSHHIAPHRATSRHIATHRDHQSRVMHPFQHFQFLQHINWEIFKLIHHINSLQILLIFVIYYESVITITAAMFQWERTVFNPSNHAPHRAHHAPISPASCTHQSRVMHPSCNAPHQSRVMHPSCNAPIMQCTHHAMHPL